MSIWPYAPTTTEQTAAPSEGQMLAEAYALERRNTLLAWLFQRHGVDESSGVGVTTYQVETESVPVQVTIKQFKQSLFTDYELRATVGDLSYGLRFDDLTTDVSSIAGDQRYNQDQPAYREVLDKVLQSGALD